MKIYQGHIVDVARREIFDGEVVVDDGRMVMRWLIAVCNSVSWHVRVVARCEHLSSPWLSSACLSSPN